MKKSLLALAALAATFANFSNVNATALSTYDPPTGILTVPSVMVGDKIYTNVILKLLNLEVLAIDSNSLAGQTLNDAFYTYNGCYRSSNVLTCNMTITSPNKSLTLYFCHNYFVLTDDRGNRYSPNSLRIANDSDLNCGYFTFAPNVQTAMQMTFNNIATNATSVSQLTIGSSSKNISFSNQVFISGQAPNPF